VVENLSNDAEHGADLASLGLTTDSVLELDATAPDATSVAATAIVTLPNARVTEPGLFDPECSTCMITAISDPRVP
jgi:hypothetical protein